MPARPFLLLVTGPSGAGKSSLLKSLFEKDPRLGFSVSATTRAPREGEVDGREYFFLSEEEFVARREKGDFVEWAEVHAHFYGTLFAEVDRMMAEGRIPVLDVDVQGGRAVLDRYDEQVVSVFVFPPSWDDLERRLRGRATDDEETVRRRLKNAREEVRSASLYRFWVVNDELDRARADLQAILRAHELRAEGRSLPDLG